MSAGHYSPVNSTVNHCTANADGEIEAILSTTARTKARACTKVRVHFDSMIAWVWHILLTKCPFCDHELVLFRVMLCSGLLVSWAPYNRNSLHTCVATPWYCGRWQKHIV